VGDFISRCVASRRYRAGGSDALLQFAKEQAREFHVALRQMVDASEPGETLLVPLRMTPVKGWSSNSLTLMGDAVHLMPPTGSHGGNNALRDAALLGRALQEAAQGAIPVGDALARYQQEMLAYSSREVRAALRMLRLSLTRNPLIRVPLLKSTAGAASGVPGERWTCRREALDPER